MVSLSEICYSDNHKVIITAAKELWNCFCDLGIRVPFPKLSDTPPCDSVYISTAAHCPNFTKMVMEADVNLHNIPIDIDAFEVFFYHKTLWVLGSNELGALNGVYELKKSLYRDKKISGSFHLKGEFMIPMRIFHPSYQNIPGCREDIRYISHIGATHALLWHDWSDYKKFRNVAKSDMFPTAAAIDFDERRKKIREAIDVCSEYGLKPAVWMTEIACQDGPWMKEEERQKFLTLFPREFMSDSGTYQGMVLCFGEERVRAYYRNMLENFLNDYPEISMIFVFTQDSGGEFCDPDSCERCKGMSKLEQRDRFLSFLCRVCNEINPDIRVITTTWGWEQRLDGGASNAEELAARQLRLPQNSGVYMPAEIDGWQSERQLHSFMMQMKNVCEKTGQILIGYDNLHLGDDSVMLHTGYSTRDIQDYPFGIGAKIKRWFMLGADGVFDHWGAYNEDVPMNSQACREFYLNPLADPKKICRKIAEYEFSKKTSGKVYQAWEALEQAQRILSNACSFQPHQWIGWLSCLCNLDFEGIKSDVNRLSRLANIRKPANGFLYNPASLYEVIERIVKCYGLAEKHLQRAAEHMKDAYRAATDAQMIGAYRYRGNKKTPTEKEHIRRQLLYIESLYFGNGAVKGHFAAIQSFMEQSKEKSEEKIREKFSLYMAGRLKEAIVGYEKLTVFLEQTAEEFGDNERIRRLIAVYHTRKQAVESVLK